MVMRHRYSLFLIAALLVCADSPVIAEGSGADQPDQADQLPWAVRLGLRVWTVEQAAPIVDQVVLVPDGATYLDEIQHWSSRGRWPVLYNDHPTAARFIRRFRPAVVIERESVGGLPRGEELEARLREAHVRAMGGHPDREEAADIFRRNDYTPPGIVVTSARDSAWPAAVALAAGRLQPLHFIDEDYGRPNSVVDRERVAQLNEQIREAVRATGYPWESLEEGILTVTLCRTVAGRVRLPRAEGTDGEPGAISDWLGRHDDGSRYGFVGWIFGSEHRSAYMAMCSLFLPRNDVWLANGYPNEGGFAQFNMQDAADRFEDRAYDVTHLAGAQFRAAAWQNTISSGIDPDLFNVNSRGNAHFYHVFDERLWAADVPLLNVPAAVHFTHSWSARQPTVNWTVGARFLNHGAYAYVGSVHEPLLAAFIPPGMLAERLVNHVPLLVASRHWSGAHQFARPWKVQTIGDPLMLAVPPDRLPQERSDPEAEDRGRNVREDVRQAMRGLNDEGAGDQYAEVIRGLELIGRDELALEIWRLAEQHGQAEAAAPAALGPLFRAGQSEEFLSAWKHVTVRDEELQTMLWHLFTPRLGSVRDEDTLLQLQAAVRSSMPEVDARRLAPHLARRLGSEHVRAWLQRLLDETENARARRGLEEALRDY